MSRFQEAIKPILGLLPKAATEELENNLQRHAVAPSHREETSRGSRRAANPPSRDQAYVYLQLFIPFAEQLMRLRHELSEPARPRLVHTT